MRSVHGGNSTTALFDWRWNLTPRRAIAQDSDRTCFFIILLDALPVLSWGFLSRRTRVAQCGYRHSVLDTNVWHTAGMESGSLRVKESQR